MKEAKNRGRPVQLGGKGESSSDSSEGYYLSSQKDKTPLRGFATRGSTTRPHPSGRDDDSDKSDDAYPGLSRPAQTTSAMGSGNRAYDKYRNPRNGGGNDRRTDIDPGNDQPDEIKKRQQEKQQEFEQLIQAQEKANKQVERKPNSRGAGPYRGGAGSGYRDGLKIDQDQYIDPYQNQRGSEGQRRGDRDYNYNQHQRYQQQNNYNNPQYQYGDGRSGVPRRGRAGYDQSSKQNNKGLTPTQHSYNRKRGRDDKVNYDEYAEDSGAEDYNLGDQQQLIENNQSNNNPTYGDFNKYFDNNLPDQNAKQDIKPEVRRGTESNNRGYKRGQNYAAYSRPQIIEESMDLPDKKRGEDDVPYGRNQIVPEANFNLTENQKFVDRNFPPMDSISQSEIDIQVDKEDSGEDNEILKSIQRLRDEQQKLLERNMSMYDSSVTNKKKTKKSNQNAAGQDNPDKYAPRKNFNDEADIDERGRITGVIVCNSQRVGTTQLSSRQSQLNPTTATKNKLKGGMLLSRPHSIGLQANFEYKNQIYYGRNKFIRNSDILERKVEKDREEGRIPKINAKSIIKFNTSEEQESAQQYSDSAQMMVEQSNLFQMYASYYKGFAASSHNV